MNKWIIALGLLLSAAIGYSASPVVMLNSPSPQTVTVNTTITVAGSATDADGDLSEHWLEVRRPAGDWSWQGWLPWEPFGPALNGDGYSSTKSGPLTLSDIGTYTFRVTAIDVNGSSYSISNEVQITVTGAQGHINIPASVTLIN